MPLTTVKLSGRLTEAVETTAAAAHFLRNQRCRLEPSEDGHYLFFSEASEPSSESLPPSLQILDVTNGQAIQTNLKAYNLYELHQQPGGSAVAVVDATATGTWRGKRIGLLDPASGDVTDLTPEDVAAIQPAWSPDGSQIAYAASPAAPDAAPGSDEATRAYSQRHIWLMSSDGSGQRQLTDDPRYRDEQPQWTADGTHLLFARIDLQDEAPQASLWLLDPTNGDLQQVVAKINYPSTQQPNPTLPLAQWDAPAWAQLYDYWPGPNASAR